MHCAILSIPRELKSKVDTIKPLPVGFVVGGLTTPDSLMITALPEASSLDKFIQNEILVLVVEGDGEVEGLRKVVPLSIE